MATVDLTVLDQSNPDSRVSAWTVREEAPEFEGGKKVLVGHQAGLCVRVVTGEDVVEFVIEVPVLLQAVGGAFRAQREDTADTRRRLDAADTALHGLI